MMETREILMRLAEQDSLLRMAGNPSGTSPSAFNAGIKAARGQYVGILRAHIITPRTMSEPV